MIVLRGNDEGLVKRRGSGLTPPGTSMETRTEAAQPRMAVILKGQPVMGSSRGNGTHEELGDAKRRVIILEQYLHRWQLRNRSEIAAVFTTYTRGRWF